MTGSRAAVRRRRDDRARDQGHDPRGGAADRVGRRGGDQARREDRLGPAQARRAGRRAAGRGGRVPRAAADLAAVGRGREDGGRAARLRGPDDRGPGGAAARGDRAAVRQARRVARDAGPRASTPTRSRPASPRSRSGTSTRSATTPPSREVIERTLLGMADGVAWRLRSAGLQGGDDHAQAARHELRHDHPPDDARGAGRSHRADLRGRAPACSGRSSTGSGSGWWA